MRPQLIFGISVAFSLLAWGVVTQQYIWPMLRHQPRENALRAILTFHAFRFIGLAFLLPGVVSPELPLAFARPAAYGDLAAAILALLGLLTLRSRLGTVLVWAFNLLGTADLLYAFYQGNRVNIAATPGLLGAAYFLLAIVVPLLLITHGLVFRLLLRPGAAVVSIQERRAA